MRSIGVGCRRMNGYSSPGGCRLNSGSWRGGRPMNQDFVDLLRAFIDRDVRFLVVGAYALAQHGRPRATGHLGVWVEPEPGNAGDAGAGELRGSAERCHGGRFRPTGRRAADRRAARAHRSADGTDRAPVRRRGPPAARRISGTSKAFERATASRIPRRAARASSSARYRSSRTAR